MSGYWFKQSATGVIVRMKLNNSSATSPTNAGLTGLTNTSAGLIIATACDVEATSTTYTQSGATIGTITTLGTYAAPSAGQCNFRQFDSTNFPGWYEFQFLNARFAVANAKFLFICVPAVGGLNLAQQDLAIPLTDIDPYSRAAMFQSPMTEGYSANGTASTPEQALFELKSTQQNMSITGTVLTSFKINGVTAAMTFNLNSASTPTSKLRAT